MKNTQAALEGLKDDFSAELDYALPERDGQFKAWLIGNLAEIVRNRVQCSDFAEMLIGAGKADRADLDAMARVQPLCECGDPQCLEPFDGEVEARDAWFSQQERGSWERQQDEELAR